MSESQPATEPTPPETDGPRKLQIEELALAALGLLSLVGIAVSDFSTRQSFRYWILIAPVFAAVSIYTGWSRAREQGQSVSGIMLRQVLHWGVLPIAIYVVYLMQATGRLNREDAGLVVMLSLAITTFLAGVHFDWRLGVLGVVLGAGALFAALVEEFFWVFLIVAVPVIGVVWWRGRKRGPIQRDLGG